jgi:signal transduction histidine kinase
MVIVCGAIVLACADATLTLFMLARLGRPVRWAGMFGRDLTFWLTFVFWMPAVLFTAKRFQLAWPVDPRRVVVHIAGGSCFAVLHIATTTWLDPMRPRAVGAFRALFMDWLMRYWALDFLAYWAVVAAFYTIHYYRQSRERELAAARLQSSLTESRLQALRAQLNPHFLFNTLHSISVLVRKGDDKSVLLMLNRLGQVLRSSLDENCPQEIPLAKELEFLDGYLDIQRIRFADRLSVRRDVSPDVLDALVPAMILQPLVENAVVHGVAARSGSGHIRIEATHENGSLRLRVSDTGPGFQTRSGGRLQERIGLVNTRARLEQLYGNQQALEYGGTHDHGGVVTISFPYRTASTQHSGGGTHD